MKDLVRLVKILRKKCPWDQKQTLRSMKYNVVEEAYELVDAIERKDLTAIKEEIGDILFLGIFLARILEQEKKVNFNHLISGTIQKYRTKHPHVFKSLKLKDDEAVLQYWQKNKEDAFAGISTKLPALLAAEIIQARASKLGFDWNSYKGPLSKVEEELREIKKSLKDRSRAKVFEEFGDLLFASVNLARHLRFNPEDALRHANKKFVRRFRKIKEKLAKKGKKIEDAKLEEMDRIWNRIKRK